MEDSRLGKAGNYSYCSKLETISAGDIHQHSSIAGTAHVEHDALLSEERHPVAERNMKLSENHSRFAKGKSNLLRAFHGH